MDDILGRVFSYILLIFGLFFVAPLFVFLNADITTRNYVNTCVNEFTEEARAGGVITKADYNQLVNRLTASGDTYIITMEHKSKILVPDEDGNYQTVYESHPTNEILSILFGYGSDGEPGSADDVPEGEDYVMKNGDYLTITAKSNSPSIGTRFYSGIRFQSGGIKLRASAGGIVGKTAR